MCLERLRGLRMTGKEVRCVVFASAFAADVIMMYCFGESYNRLEAPDFDALGYDCGHALVTWGPLMKHLIWILWTIQSLPKFIANRMGVAIVAFNDLNDVRELLSDDKVPC